MKRLGGRRKPLAFAADAVRHGIRRDRRGLLGLAGFKGIPSGGLAEIGYSILLLPHADARVCLPHGDTFPRTLLQAPAALHLRPR
jgi:hypothetical protein